MSSLRQSHRPRHPTFFASKHVMVLRFFRPTENYAVDLIRIDIIMKYSLV